jgi:GTPase
MTDSRIPSDDLQTDITNPNTHAGFVAIVGKPNVGKSTLLNAMMGVKIAPVTDRPQTTRRGVRGISTIGNRQAVFVDTPGVHKPKDALGKYMNDEVHSALADVDAVIWVVDLRRPPADEDAMVARALKGFSRPLWVVGNKLDAAKYPDEAMNHYIKLLEQTEFNQVRLSAQNDWNAVAGLLEEVMAVLPKNPFFFPGAGKSDQPKEVWAAELIREEAMKALYEELPYTVATRVTSWEQRADGMNMIQAEIIVEKMQHRSMVIGKGGAMIKKIGQRTRKQLEVFLSARVFLGLEVIVISEWRSDQEALRELGYE